MTRFAELFADERMVEVLKQMSLDPFADASARRKLVAVLAFWRSVYEDEPAVSGLYRKCRPKKKEYSVHVQQVLADVALQRGYR